MTVCCIEYYEQTGKRLKAGEEEGKLGELRRELLTFLETSTKYDPTDILKSKSLPENDLLEERAVWTRCFSTIKLDHIIPLESSWRGLEVDCPQIEGYWLCREVLQPADYPRPKLLNNDLYYSSEDVWSMIHCNSE